MSKTALISHLTKLAEALGIPPTPLTWRLADARRLEELIAELEARLREADANAADQPDDLTATRRRNDDEWYKAGGTRN